jgi:hypothetical protein
MRDLDTPRRSWLPWRFFSLFKVPTDPLAVVDGEESPETPKKQSWKDRGDNQRKVRTDMIRRMDDAPKLVNPSGWISEGQYALATVDEKPPFSETPSTDLRVPPSAQDQQQYGSEEHTMSDSQNEKRTSASFDDR